MAMSQITRGYYTISFLFTYSRTFLDNSTDCGSFLPKSLFVLRQGSTAGALPSASFGGVEGALCQGLLLGCRILRIRSPSDLHLWIGFVGKIYWFKPHDINMGKSGLRFSQQNQSIEFTNFSKGFWMCHELLQGQ